MKSGNVQSLRELDDSDFIALISPEIEDDIAEQINLAAERGNPEISLREFAGFFE